MGTGVGMPDGNGVGKKVTVGAGKGTAVGWARIDSLAASVVGLMVAGMGFEVGRDSLRFKLAR